MNKFTVAVLQLDSQDDVQKNLDTVVSFIEEAAARGAKLITMPESMNYVGLDNAGHAEEIPGGPTFQLMSEQAKKYGVWLHCGSIYEKNPNDPRPFNSTMVIDPRGNLAAKYHKIHPFDVVIPNGPVNRESERICPGDEIVTVDTGEVGHLGLSICYDMRFPELCRLMADACAEVIVAPAAFNMTTGPAHWDLLFRQRAVDNQCFTLGCAPARDTGASYVSYGCSIAVSPWGDVLSRLDEKPGLLVAELDLDRVKAVRTQLPLLKGRRLDVYSLKKLVP